MSVAWLDALSETGRRLGFRPGCTSSDIQAAEAQLGVSLPASLSDFLRASDGFIDLESQYEYAWPIKTIVAENRRAWSDRAMQLDEGLVSFGADGAGDWFCLRLDTGNGPVYHWAWITGEAREVAADLSAFWPDWLRGSLTVLPACSGDIPEHSPGPRLSSPMTMPGTVMCRQAILRVGRSDR